MARIRSFDTRPGMHKPHPVRGGIIVLAIVLFAFYFAFSGGSIPFLSGGGYTLKGVFSTGVNLRSAKTPVRFGGVKVGEVSGVTRTADGKDVVVSMNITNNDLHLTNLASAHIYWRTLLGFQYYIELYPGSGSSPLNGQTIPLSRTGVQVEIDQVLSTLTAPSRTGIQQTFDQFGIAFGPGNAAGAAIDATAPALHAVTPALKALQGEYNGDLGNTVTQANHLVSGLLSSDNQLADLVTTASTTFAATTAQRSSIDSLLQNGPSTLDTTRTSLANLDNTLNLLDPVSIHLLPGAREITPAATHLDPALKQLIPLLNNARPTLVSLRPAVEQLGQASVTGVPLMSELMPTLSRANSTILPELQATDPSTGLKTYEAIGPTFANVEDSTKMYDANGHVQRFHAVAGGFNSVGALPCTTSVSPTVSITCPQITKALLALLGGS